MKILEEKREGNKDVGHLEYGSAAVCARPGKWESFVSQRIFYSPAPGTERDASLLVGANARPHGMSLKMRFHLSQSHVFIFLMKGMQHQLCVGFFPVGVKYCACEVFCSRKHS